MRIYVATTAHGMGHIARIVPVLGALHELDPAVEIILSSSVTAEWLHAQLGYVPVVVQRPYEIGVAQRNCFETDPERTLVGYREYARGHAERLAAEELFLREQKVDGIVVDVPSLPVAAAADLGLPVVAVSNFTWDWILAELLGEAAGREVEVLRNDYARGGLHLQLPFSTPVTPFPRAERAPLLARMARLTRSQVRGLLGLGSEERPLVMVSSGGWSAAEWPEIQIEAAADFQFVLVGDLPIRAARALHLPQVLPAGLTMVDLINAADVVMAKPGYGIASECLLHRTPLVAIERQGMAETPILLEEFAAAGQLACLALVEFFAGKWQAALEEALASDSSWQEISERPDLVIARRILEELAR